jgi:hypothetical protein
MKPAILTLAVLASITFRSNAELFSSSTNFIQTLTIASNEVIFISGLVYSPSFGTGGECCRATIVQGANVFSAPLANSAALNWPATLRIQALAGPMQVQFQKHNVHLAFSRVQITNIFTVHLDATNMITINIPLGKTIHFLGPISWQGESGVPSFVAGASFSNIVAVVENYIYDGDAFTGPLAISLCACAGPGVADPTDTLVTYYFTEEFATIPEVGAIQVPAGKAQIQIEKSDDMQNWRTVFFHQVNNDTRGFYRLKATK